MKDDYYNDYSQQEYSDGYAVTGSYQVLLPDGRVQYVDYKADDYTGYVADVSYKGEAKAYDYKPAYKAEAYLAPVNKLESYPPPIYRDAAYPAPVHKTDSYPPPVYRTPAQSAEYWL